MLKQKPELEKNEVEKATSPEGEAASIEKKSGSEFIGKFVYQLVVLFGIIFVFSIFIGRVLFFPIRVINISMQPTYNALATDNGRKKTDTVYVGTPGKIDIGDVLVFDSHNVVNGGTQYYIKRVVGTPGDIISFKILDVFQGFVTYTLERNGRVIEESYIAEEMKCYYTKTEEEANFYQKYLLPSESEKERIKLEKNEFFMMGDNRNFSQDSRFFGPVKKADVIGKVYLHIEYGDGIIKAIFKAIF